MDNVVTLMLSGADFSLEANEYTAGSGGVNDSGFSNGRGDGWGFGSPDGGSGEGGGEGYGCGESPGFGGDGAAKGTGTGSGDSVGSGSPGDAGRFWHFGRPVGRWKI